MSAAHTIEVDGDLIGILTRDAASASYHFHSGVAPYDLLDGSRFRRAEEAHLAIERMRRAARRVAAPASGSVQ